VPADDENGLDASSSADDVVSADDTSVPPEFVNPLSEPYEPPKTTVVAAPPQPVKPAPDVVVAPPQPVKPAPEVVIAPVQPSKPAPEVVVAPPQPVKPAPESRGRSASAGHRRRKSSPPRSRRPRRSRASCIRPTSSASSPAVTSPRGRRRRVGSIGADSPSRRRNRRHRSSRRENVADAGAQHESAWPAARLRRRDVRRPDAADASESPSSTRASTFGPVPASSGSERIALQRPRAQPVGRTVQLAVEDVLLLSDGGSSLHQASVKELSGVWTQTTVPLDRSAPRPRC
jgi:hypothetical protein